MSLLDFGFLRHKKNAGSSSRSTHEKGLKRKGQGKESAKKKSRVEDSFGDGLARLQKSCDKHQLKIVDVPKDGNCFFHAISHQLELRGEYFSHAELRKNTVKYMNTLKKEDPDHPVSTMINDAYLRKMSKEGTWADHPTIQSLAQMMKTNLKIFTSLQNMDITKIDGGGDWNSPLLLAYIFETHYMSVVSATAGRPTTAAESPPCSPTSVDSPAGPSPPPSVEPSETATAGRPTTAAESPPCSPTSDSQDEPAGPSPPPSVEREGTGKNYSQSYRPEWEQKTWAKGWLTKDKDGSAFCKWCSKKLKAKLSVLKSHTQSTKHVQEAKTQNRAPMEKFATNFTSVAQAELNLVAMIVRKNVSFRFADDLIATLKHIEPTSKTIQALRCGRTKVTYLLTECLAPFSHADLVEKLKASKGFSILCDKATDITTEQTFCVNVRFYEGGKAVTSFYRLIKVGLEDGTAAGLFSLLDEALKKDGLSWTSVIGFGSDGENLMQGGVNSLMTKIQETVPQVFVLKCFCHTFHLIASYACQHLSKTAEQFVHDVYNYFKTSSKRKQKFEQIQKALNIAPHKLLRPAQTRWLSLHQCVSRVMEQWPALYAFFEQELRLPASSHNPTAAKLYNDMRKKTVLATLQFMNYILPEFTIINKMFQSDTFKLHRLLPEVRRIIRSLCMNFMEERFVVATPVSQVPNFRNPETYKRDDSIYPGEDAYQTTREMVPHERETFQVRCRAFFIEAVKQIIDRIDVNDRVLHHLQFLSPDQIRTARSPSSTGNILATRFSNACNVRTIDRQWRSLLHEQELIRDLPVHIGEFWGEVGQHGSYKELGQFVGFLFGLPQSTATVERTFSVVGLNKTKLRNRLGVTTVEAILQASQFFVEPFQCSKKMKKLHRDAFKSYHSKYNENDRQCQEEDDGPPLLLE